MSRIARDRRLRTLRTALGVPLVLSVIGTARAGAQESVESRSSWLGGGSIGMFGVGTEPAPPQLMTVGMHFTQVRVGRVGADLAIGTVPMLMASGGVVLTARAGVALALQAAPAALFLPSAGVSVLGAASANGAGALPGLNMGAALVLGTGPVAFRGGVTCHKLLGLRPAVWLLEVGFVRLLSTPG